jgi:hypothetical protein
LISASVASHIKAAVIFVSIYSGANIQCRKNPKRLFRHEMVISGLVRLSGLGGGISASVMVYNNIVSIISLMDIISLKGADQGVAKRKEKTEPPVLMN